ncbi:MAG: hypothetical protein R3D33_06615 [Hyphomicrobiaceae bacterium]
MQRAGCGGAIGVHPTVILLFGLVSLIAFALPRPAMAASKGFASGQEVIDWMGRYRTSPDSSACRRPSMR